MNQEVKIINGYPIKDETARNKIEDMKEKVEFIFPKFWANAYSGDSNLIKYKDKVIMIDCYNTDQWTNVKAMLDDNNINHIDYLVISHYHGDHVGNFQNLIDNNYIDNNTNLYMPLEVEGYTTIDIPSTVIYYKNLCITNGLTYHVPTEGEYFNIDDLKCTFYNADKEYIEENYVSYDAYNDASTILLVEYRDIKALYTGDISYRNLQTLRNNNIIKGRIDLYKIPHHGINTMTDDEFIKGICPTYAVQTSGIVDETNTGIAHNPEISLFREIGTKVYPVHIQNNYLKFESEGKNVYCVNGKPKYLSYQTDNITYYVDINASKNDIQDGTQSYPFSELMQAITRIDSFPTRKVTINLADGHYCISHEDMARNKTLFETGRDVEISIIGNTNDRTKVIIDNVYARNSNISFANLTINIDNYDGVELNNTYCKLDNILITSLTETLSTSKVGIIANHNSNVLIDNVKVEYANNGLRLRNGSIAIINSIYFGSINDEIISSTNSYSVINSVSFDNSSEKLKFKNYMNLYRDKLQIMGTHETYATTIPLTINTTNLAWLEIHYRTNDYEYASTGRIYSPNSKNISLFATHSDSNGIIYNKQCRAVVNTDNITLDRMQEVKIENGVVTTTTGNNYFQIINVMCGYYNDYLSLQ